MRLLLIIITLITALAAGLAIVQDPGYALLSYQHWVVELPLWLFILAMLIVMITLMVVYRVLSSILTIGERFSRFRRRRRRQKASRLTRQAVLKLTEGDWQRAEDYALQAAELSKAPLVNHLTAARAAQARGAIDKRDKYLQEALVYADKNDLVVGMTQAELQLAQGQLEQCYTTLQQLNKINPKHPQVIKLQSQLYEQQEDWEALLKLLPEMRKQKLLTQDRATQLEKKSIVNILSNQQYSVEQVITLWKQLPKALLLEIDLIIAFAKFLFNKEAYLDAQELIQNTLKKQWSSKLARLYGLLRSAEPHKQLKIAQSWLKKHANDADLLLTLGRLSIRTKQWEQAEQFLEQALQCQASQEAYAELGRLMEFLGKNQQSKECYRQGLLADPNLVLGEFS